MRAAYSIALKGRLFLRSITFCLAASCFYYASCYFNFYALSNILFPLDKNFEILFSGLSYFTDDDKLDEAEE